MLVYGDIERLEKPVAARASIARLMMACSELEPGRERHESLVKAFIATGELVQGLADREFDLKGADDVSKIQDAGAKLLLGQAQAILQSWRNGFDGLLPLPENWRTALGHLDSGEQVRMKRGEGYAFYALYPETYIEAASKSKLTPETIVIGIRSIGIGLAALVSAAIGARPAYSLRPIGNPYERGVRVTSKLSRCMLANPRADFAIVDEGPGLSGSSFGSVADWLEANGVARDRIHFFPSHAGDPGPHASAPHRTRWKQGQRHVIGFDDAILNSPWQKHRLQTWVTDLVGRANWSCRDLSGGAWRAVRYDDPSLWPPSYRQMEKRKFLMQAEDRAWHVKFAGLYESEDKVRRGSLLAEAGFTPKVAGACYGFIVERWVDGASLDSVNVSKRAMVDHLGRYLSFRARHFPRPGGGASIQTLCDMAICNVETAVGAKSAEKLRPLVGSPGRLCRNLHRVDTDNRLHPWEWLITGDQKLVKTDALDHNSAHDLVGCQDVAWDVAGACVEFDLSSGERQRLAGLIAQEVDCDLRDQALDVFEACYLGFQIGLWSQASAIVDSAERPRIEGRIKWYLTRLRQLSDRLD
jgi:hypothetical protein